MISVKETGRIKELKKSIVKIEGLSNCMSGQLIDFGNNVSGIVMGFNEDEVLVLLLGAANKVKAGDSVYSDVEFFKVPVGKNFVGRIVNALCQPIDGKSAVKDVCYQDMFREAPSVLDRIPIDEMFITGIRIIDSTIPIGKGQRELVIGDRMTGKTALCIDTILNQKGKNIICIYCCIGRDYASFKRIVGLFKEKGGLDYTTIVSATASASIGEQYLAPYTAAALGEYFMYTGRDVFVVFDDLTKHAWAYRELSLLLERPPGREAYPGDIFYVHAQLMERAGRLAKSKGGGSMTFFPIVDTLQGDFTGFIPTNIISMTDGQIYLNSSLFSEGFKPSIDIGLSVSRIGNKVHPKLMRRLSQDLGLGYIQYRELLKATKLKAGISEEVNVRLKHGEKIEKIFIQDKNSPSSLEEQMFFFFTLKEGILDNLNTEQCEQFKKGGFMFMQKKYPNVSRIFQTAKELTDDDKKKIKECIGQFFKTTQESQER